MASRAPVSSANRRASSSSPSGAMTTSSSSPAATATGSPASVARQSDSNTVILRPAGERSSWRRAASRAPARSVVPKPRNASTASTTSATGRCSPWGFTTIACLANEITLKSSGLRHATAAAATALVASGPPVIEPLRSRSMQIAVAGRTQPRCRSSSTSTAVLVARAIISASTLASMSRSLPSGRNGTVAMRPIRRLPGPVLATSSINRPAKRACQLAKRPIHR